MGFIASDIRYKSDTACVVLKGRGVKTSIIACHIK